MERTYAVTPMTTGSPASANLGLRVSQVSQVHFSATTVEG